MFANNPLGLVVKGMMEELREDGEISSHDWQDSLRERAAKIVHALENRREHRTEVQHSELHPCETSS